MMHSSPLPLNVALDMVKRLHHELAKHMTPEQKRDFARVEHLIKQAQQSASDKLARQAEKALMQAETVGAERKSLWRR